jgi:hypothetical protein
VAAVDGSQIPPSKEISTPVGAVQIGWYINYHVAGGRYEKDVAFTVLAPDELGEEEGGEFPDWRVNQQRFRGRMRAVVGVDGAFRRRGERPLCFFDGSFIISFVGQIRPGRAEAYLKAVQRAAGSRGGVGDAAGWLCRQFGQSRCRDADQHRGWPASHEPDRRCALCAAVGRIGATAPPSSSAPATTR